MTECAPMICKGCKFNGVHQVKGEKVKSCNYMDTVREMQVIADRENELANMKITRKIPPFNVRCGFRKEVYD